MPNNQIEKMGKLYEQKFTEHETQTTQIWKDLQYKRRHYYNYTEMYSFNLSDWQKKSKHLKTLSFGIIKKYKVYKCVYALTQESDIGEFILHIYLYMFNCCI